MQELMTFLSNHMVLVSVIIVVLILLTLVELNRKKTSVHHISVTELTQLINRENAVLLDIRPVEMYRKAHIIDAVSLNAKEILEKKKLDKYKKRPLVIIDQTGADSRKLAAQLRNQGYNAYSLSGGTQKWTDAEMPLVKG